MFTVILDINITILLIKTLERIIRELTMDEMETQRTQRRLNLKRTK